MSPLSQLVLSLALMGAVEPQVPSPHVLALADLLTLNPIDRFYTRYVHIPNPTVNDVKVVSFVSFWLGNMPAAPETRPPVVQGGNMQLVRLDPRAFLVHEEDQKRWLKTWEELTFDPNFSLLITSDSIKLLGKVDGKWPFGIKEVSSKTGKFLIDVPPYTENGQEWKEKWVNVVRVPSDNVNKVALARLERETGSTAPVVNHHYFEMRATASIRESGVFESIFGGLYYDFAGIRTAKQAGKKKATDLDVLFQDLGIIDDADGPVKAQDKVDRLLSEQRVLLITSKVTGKKRGVAILPTLKSVRFRGVVLITLDVKDSSIDLLKDPFANLLGFEPDAREVIFVDANGSQKYALYNAQGALQREVPPDIAHDSTILPPYTQRLQTQGCITCHGTQADGWQPIPNKAQVFRKSRVDLITDLSKKDEKVIDTVNLIQSKYAGNADQLLRELKRETIGAVLQMTGPWVEKGNEDQTKVYKLTATKYNEIRKYYWYTPVDAKTALEELGVDYGKAEPLTLLKGLLKPDISSRVDVYSLVPESPRIMLLLSGESISRTDFELEKGFIQGRIHSGGKSK